MKDSMIDVTKYRSRHEVTLNRYKAESEIFGGNGVPGNDFNTVPAEKGWDTAKAGKSPQILRGRVQNREAGKQTVKII